MRYFGFINNDAAFKIDCGEVRAPRAVTDSPSEINFQFQKALMMFRNCV